MRINGVIAFGVLLGHLGSLRLPWYNRAYMGDYKRWWLDLTGFDSSVYDTLPPDRALALERQHLRMNPMPFEEINYSYENTPMIALIVPSTIMRCDLGDPIEFSVNELEVTTKEARDLVNFMDDHGIEYEDRPTWLLMSHQEAV